MIKHGDPYSVKRRKTQETKINNNKKPKCFTL